MNEMPTPENHGRSTRNFHRKQFTYVAVIGKFASVLVLIIVLAWVTGQTHWATIFAGAVVGVSLVEYLNVSKSKEFWLLLGCPVFFATVATLLPFVQQSDFSDPGKIAFSALVGALTAVIPAAIAVVAFGVFSELIFQLTGMRLFRFDRYIDPAAMDKSVSEPPECG